MNMYPLPTISKNRNASNQENEDGYCLDNIYESVNLMFSIGLLCVCGKGYVMVLPDIVAITTNA